MDTATPEPTGRLVDLVAGLISDDLRDTLAADENDQDSRAFLAEAEELDAYEDPDEASPALVVYLVGRTREQQSPQEGRKLVRVVVEAL